MAHWIKIETSVKLRKWNVVIHIASAVLGSIFIDEYFFVIPMLTFGLIDAILYDLA